MTWQKSSHLIWVLLPLIGLGLTASASDGSGCPLDMAPILAGIGARPADNSLIGDYPLRVWKGHQILANAIYSRFEAGEIKDDQIGNFSDCLQKPLNDSDLSLALNAKFLVGSLNRIKKINPEAYLRISKTNPIENMVFRIFDGNANQQRIADIAIGQRSAAFHFTTQSLFLNIAKISDIDRDIIFIHEIGHFLDPVGVHIDFYNNQKNLEEIVTLLAKYEQKGFLAETELRFLDQWLFHGISIRLLGEWRVWSFTIEFLRGGEKVALGPQTSWLAPYVHSKLSPAERKSKLFLELDKNFQDPTEGVFSNPLVKERMALLRLELRNRASHGNL